MAESRMLFVNLAVRDLKKAMTFFSALGFTTRELCDTSRQTEASSPYRARAGPRWTTW